MLAVKIEHTYRVALVFKDHELLAHDLCAERCLLDVAKVSDRLPEPAQIFACRRAARCLRYLEVWLCFRR